MTDPDREWCPARVVLIREAAIKRAPTGLEGDHD
jgi:hypothetical protein